MSNPKDEDRDSDDAAPIQKILRNLKISGDVQCKKSRQSEAVLSCGHQIPTDYLISWCKYCLKEKKTGLICPRFDEYKKDICGTKVSYQDLCLAVPLSPPLKELFEEKLGELTAAELCEFKHSYVERADRKNLCVHCTVCTAKMGCSYEFCWNCMKKWKGAMQNAVHCGYSDCGKTAETSQSNGDSLKLCQDTFKTHKLQTEEIYETKEKSSDRKRIAMIINNVQFRKIEYRRRGAEKDEENMRTLLEALGYDVIILNDLSAQGMKAAVRDFSQHKDHRYSDSTFLVVMSHGGLDGIYGINWGEEDDVLPVEKIFHYLSSENCPGLTDKPKIILIQACRGDKEGHVYVSDSMSSNKGQKQHREKDFACLRSCTPDTVSIRNTGTGSIFIQGIVEIFNEHAHEDDIMEMFRKILRWFEKNGKDNEFPYQMPCLDRTTLVKKFYLFPGL